MCRIQFQTELAEYAPSEHLGKTLVAPLNLKGLSYGALQLLQNLNTGDGKEVKAELTVFQLQVGKSAGFAHYCANLPKSAIMSKASQ